ncbi:hypothetical protein MKW92_046060, partial [Papaver armeniacum]
MENSVLKEEIVIVGGGVAGLATALALKRVGIKSLVLEKASELRVTGAALALFSNAWVALESLGVAHKLTAVYKPYERVKVTNVANGVTQETNFHKQGEEGLAIGPRAVHRKALLEALLEELPIDTCPFFVKVLIGCDGVHSVVSKWLGLKDPVHSGRCAVRGLGVFPEGHGLKHEAQQFVDRGRRFGIAPINNEEVYWFVAYQSVPNKDEEMAEGDPIVIQKTILESVSGSPQVVKDVIQQSEMQSLSWAPLLFRYPWDVIFGRLSD